MEKDRQIQLVLNSPGQEEEDSIDLGRVFHNMKLRARVFAWVTVLCMVIGVCAPLLMYQFNPPQLRVTSVATLDYELQYSWEDIRAMAQTKKERERIDQARLEGDTSLLYRQVTDLTAPNLTALDLNQITSAYVLNNALRATGLDGKVNADVLRGNISIQRILTEDSRVQQELLSSMIEDKNNNAYNTAKELELQYTNQFIVSLKNGFGQEDGPKVELKDGELRTLLNAILTSYNEYMVRTYADSRLPTDEISIIDTEELDILEALEQLRTAEQNLYDFCQNKSYQERTYVSAKTGHTLTDWMQALKTVEDTHINYLYSYVYAEGIAKDPTELISNYQYQLTNARLALEQVSENRAEVQAILDSYKNDRIFLTMQESDSSRATTDTTAYYNSLILTQANYLTQQRTLEANVAELERKIERLMKADSEKAAAVEEELQATIAATKAIYEAVYEHVAEIQEGTSFQNYVRHTEAQGKQDGFIAANIKKILIGAVVGAVLACGVWFLSALAPEFRREEKEAARA